MPDEFNADPETGEVIEPEQSGPEPAKVIGRDGKQYPKPVRA